MTKVQVFEAIASSVYSTFLAKIIIEILYSDKSEEDKYFNTYVELRHQGFYPEDSVTKANDFLAFLVPQTEPEA